MSVDDPVVYAQAVVSGSAVSLLVLLLSGRVELVSRTVFVLEVLMLLLSRELRNNRALSYCLVGFVDDDPLKKGKVIHGFRVFGGNGSFLAICKEQHVDEVLISTSKIPQVRVDQIRHDCEAAAVQVKRMRIQLEPVERRVVLGV